MENIFYIKPTAVSGEYNLYFGGIKRKFCSTDTGQSVLNLRVFS